MWVDFKTQFGHPYPLHQLLFKFYFEASHGTGVEYLELRDLVSRNEVKTSWHEWRKVFWNATLHTQNVLQVTFIGLSGAKNWRRKTSGAVIEILAFRLVLMVITLHSFTWHMQLFRITYMSLMHILAEFFLLNILRSTKNWMANIWI